MGPTWGPSGADRTQVGPCWPHELCYLGCVKSRDAFYALSMDALLIIQGCNILNLVAISKAWCNFPGCSNLALLACGTWDRINWSSLGGGLNTRYIPFAKDLKRYRFIACWMYGHLSYLVHLCSPHWKCLCPMFLEYILLCGPWHVLSNWCNEQGIQPTRPLTD